MVHASVLHSDHLSIPTSMHFAMTLAEILPSAHPDLIWLSIDQRWPVHAEREPL